MSPTEMEELCDAAISSATELGFGAAMAALTLVTPRGFKRPPQFPRGTLLQVKDDGRHVWSFNAQRLRAWVRNAQVTA